MRFRIDTGKCIRRIYVIRKGKISDFQDIFVRLNEERKQVLDVVYITVYTKTERTVRIMMIAKIFENGRSQAVRLPKECRFSSDEVMVSKIGDIVMLIPKENKWDAFMKAVDMFSEDFMQNGRAEDPVQERESL